MAAKTKDDEAGPTATNDAYTGMLAIALFALIGGCVLLYLDYSQYPDSKGPSIPKAPPIAAPAPAGGGPGAAPPVAPPPAAPPMVPAAAPPVEEKK